VLVKGDALNIYTDQQFSSNDKFVLTDGKGQQFTVKPVCLSSNQAVITVPDGAIPGMCSVSGVFMGIDQINPARFNLIDINLTSPNTNLRPGELSNVLLSANLPFGASGQNSLWRHQNAVSIDLRNLNPNIVTMEGGNLQRIYIGGTDDPDAQNGSTTITTIIRNITGNTLGTFSVSATLHEDYNTSNDPFRPQLNVLKTPEDFNAWANALKKDLKEYATAQVNDTPGAKPFDEHNINRAIDNMPVCESTEQLDESKAVAYSLLQPLHVPKGAAISWLSSYEALKAATKTIDDNLSGNMSLIDFDVLKNGIEFINRIAKYYMEPALQTECGHVQELIDQLQTTGETKENLQELRNEINGLTARADMRTGADDHISLRTGMKDLIMSSFQLPSLAGPGQVHPFNDLIGFLDPQKKMMIVVPGYEEKVLNQYHAVKLADGHYQVQTFTILHQPVGMTVSMMQMQQPDIFHYSRKEEDSLLEVWVGKLNAWARMDTTMGTLKYAKYDTATATWSRVFKNAKCEESEVAPENKKSPCMKWGKEFIQPKFPADKHCKKGFNECIEYLLEWVEADLYEDAGCTKKKGITFYELPFPVFICK
jgi:tellurite resistance-related uncharacterized protein